MARLTPQQWAQARADYESSDKSLRDIARDYQLSPSTVTRRAEKEGWQQGKTQHLVEQKTQAIKQLHQTQQQMQHLNATEQLTIDHKVAERLAAEAIFVDAATYNQALANRLLDEDGIKLSDVEAHSRITARNKETVLGKSPEAQVNIQNNAPPSRIEYVIVKN